MGGKVERDSVRRDGFAVRTQPRGVLGALASGRQAEDILRDLDSGVFQEGVDRTTMGSHNRGVKVAGRGRSSFLSSGKVFVGGTDMTPTLTDEQKAKAYLWFKVYFNGTTAVEVNADDTDTFPASFEDTWEAYRIKVAGRVLRWDDIHETRA